MGLPHIKQSVKRDITPCPPKQNLFKLPDADRLRRAAKLIALVAADQQARDELLANEPLAAALILVRTEPAQRIAAIVAAIRLLVRSLESAGKQAEAKFANKVVGGLRDCVLGMQAERFEGAMDAALQIRRAQKAKPSQSGVA
jgi:hypothetical protein